MAPALVLVSAAALLALAASWLLARAATRLVWRPRAVTARFRAQGVRGPPYRFLRGTLDEMKRMKAEGDGVAMDVRDHDILPRIMPHFLRWKEQYGTQFLYWFGPQPRIFLSDYDSVRQILSNKSGHFLKTDAHPTILAMLGKGLVLVEGTDWVRHRRVVNPAFAMDKLKMMTTTMVSCAECLIKEWQDQASNSKSGETEVEFSKQFQELTANVISRTAFGSSYKEGKEVFHAQKQLLAIAMATLLNVPLPGFKYLPTKRNRSKWMLEKKLKTTLMTIIQSRLAPKGGGYGDDLLDDNGAIETLRLYGPVIFMLRKPVSDMRLGSLIIPKGNAIVIPIPMLHREKEVWGDNANEFDPLRFETGSQKQQRSHKLL
ncbi:hypothetical protein EJB05_56208 [Eragrostis curvula]|uniref:Cytochrome P450 n=1 Tax=Eragrostis curvula TaxID=38414 RepID=A0A5J9SGQ5_9POAL|nr:hypothetical protein EJB05_56208 [Eragrostis curvula]